VKPILRLADERDAARILSIYAPFCESTAITFEVTAPTLADMQERIRKVAAQYPWLVCAAEEDEIHGYAYACAHRDRAAYRWSVDVAVYIAEVRRRAGIGRALYTSLFKILALQGYYKAYAGITLPNPESVGLHEAVGFVPVGVYRNVGYKSGAWRDVGWWALPLQPEREEPEEPRSIRVIQQTDGWREALHAGLSHLRL
jgi:L-amino acid N-acyltransferase YncA